MGRPMQYANRKQRSLNLDMDLVERMEQRYANLSDITNELYEKHLNSLKTGKESDLGYAKQAPEEPEEPEVGLDGLVNQRVEDKKKAELTALQHKLTDQFLVDRELFNKIYLKYRRKRTKEAYEARLKEFEDIWNNGLERKRKSLEGGVRIDPKAHA